MKKFKKGLICITLVMTTIFSSVFTASAASSYPDTAKLYSDKGESKSNTWTKYTKSAVSLASGNVTYNGWSYLCYHEHYGSTGNAYGKTYGNITNQCAKINNKWYYFTDHGYYRTSTGVNTRMASNEWINGYWFNKDGSWTYKAIASWKKDKNGWYYSDTKGWYAKNQWQRIDNQWYYFNAKGYAVSGWQKISGKYYYFYTGKETDINEKKKQYKNWFPQEAPAFSMANDGFVKTKAPGNKEVTNVYFFATGEYDD